MYAHGCGREGFLKQDTERKQGKMDILDYIKITNFCFSKGNMKGIKWQGRNWEKILATCITKERFIPIKYNELSQINRDNTNNPIKMSRN